MYLDEILLDVDEPLLDHLLGTACIFDMHMMPPYSSHCGF